MVLTEKGIAVGLAHVDDDTLESLLDELGVRMRALVVEVSRRADGLPSTGRNG